MNQLYVFVERWTNEGARRALSACLAMAVLFATGRSTSPQCTPSVCGQWEGPYHLDVSCPFDDTCGADEIGHLTLIPTGMHKGRVLFWTRCHNPANRVHPTDPAQNCSTGTPYEYKGHVLDPQTMSLVDHPTFQTAYPAGVNDGSFCAGHTWILDSEEKPKFLVVGGVQFGPPQVASKETFWYDPNPPSPTPPGWFDGPGTLPVLETDQQGSWYPTVSTFFDAVLQRFRAIAYGGTSKPAGGCGDRYNGWWTMSLAGAWSAVTNTDGYQWPFYPRGALLHTDSGQGEIVTAGVDHICDMDAPCQKIVTVTNPQTHQQLPNQPAGVGVWHTNHAVLLHTLKAGWQWDTVTPLAQYHLNRLIGTMGTGTGAEAAPAMPETRELVGGNWAVKADAPQGRIFSNGVLLPDGSLLVVGGQNEDIDGGGDFTVYWNTAVRFDPQQPSNLGVWTTLAATNPAPGAPYSTPRGYHSVAILLPDGSVLLMGGMQDIVIPLRYPLSDPEDTVDHFKPPYFFTSGTRPVLHNAPSAIHYGETYCFTPLVEAGHSIVRFCLIGIGSVTHHQDFGQRYVELMFRPVQPGPPPYSCTTEILAPPVPDMAPEGIYMLFGVDDRGLPSLAKFVKLTL